MLAKVFPDSAQKIQVIFSLKKHYLAIIAAIVEMIILVGQKRCGSARHGICSRNQEASRLRFVKTAGVMSSGER
jgi:hypothetical protein